MKFQLRYLVGTRKRFISRGFVANLPIENNIVFLIFFIVTNQWRARCKCLHRVDYRREWFVINDDRFATIFRDIRVIGDNTSNFLSLKTNFVRC